MNKPFIIFIEGSIGAGKSTVTKALREELKYTTLLDLSSIQDKSMKFGREKMYKYHDGIFQMFEDTFSCGMNYVCSRSFLSELCYTELGFKDYSFRTHANALMSTVDYLTQFYNVYFVLLNVDEKDMEDRLKRDKFQYVTHSVENAIQQQNMYQSIFRHYAKEDSDIGFFEIENKDLQATVSAIKDIILTGMIGE